MEKKGERACSIANRDRICKRNLRTEKRMAFLFATRQSEKRGGISAPPNTNLAVEFPCRPTYDETESNFFF